MLHTMMNRTKVFELRVVTLYMFPIHKIFYLYSHRDLKKTFNFRSVLYLDKNCEDGTKTQTLHTQFPLVFISDISIVHLLQ